MVMRKVKKMKKVELNIVFKIISFMVLVLIGIVFI